MKATKTPQKRCSPLRPLTEAEQQLVLDNTGLAHQGAANGVRVLLARRKGQFFPRYGQFYDELIDGAYLGLCIAAQRFDASLGWKFSTYAYHWIRQGVQKAIHQSSIVLQPLSRTPKYVAMFSEQNHIDRGRGELENELEVWDNSPIEDPEPQAGDFRQEFRVLMNLVLNKRQVRLLVMRFVEDRSLESISLVEKVSKERVRQLINKTLERLKHHSGFMHALEKQVYRVRRELNAKDFFGTGTATKIC